MKGQSGHASIQMTVDVYGHSVPGSNWNAVNQLDDEGDFGLRTSSYESVIGFLNRRSEVRVLSGVVKKRFLMV